MALTQEYERKWLQNKSWHEPLRGTRLQPRQGGGGYRRDSFGQPYDFRQAWIAKRGHTPGVALFRELPAGKPQHGEARPAYLPFPGTGRPSEPHTAGRTGGKIYGKMGYGDQPYIVYKHADTHNAHIHIVSVCVDGQGKRSAMPTSTAVP